eukprot:810433_1
MGTIKLCSLLTIAVTITSQSTRCVWFSIDEWDHVNGEYIENGTWYNGKNTYPKWKRESITCPDTQQYLFGTYYSKDKMSFWSIYPSLSNDLSRNPDCGNDDKMASDPSLCKKGWTVWQNDKDYTDIPLQVADSICPSLPCVYIQVTNSGVSACNQVFSKDPSKDHVYYHTDQGTTTYLFFNIYTFKWHCSYTLDHTYCGDDTGINALLSSKSDGWDEVNLNAQFTLPMDNGANAIFACLDSTLAPTHNPSPAPSSHPTHSPSRLPSPSPTEIPTRNPTPAPTQAPTDHPTKHPTTRAPTPPGTMVCGEMDVGEYNGEVITFMVSHTARGDITFDASQSQFTILNMEATTELNTVLLDTDEDNDGIIVIEDTPAGNYKFSVFGGTDTGMVYWVMTTCTSYDPTNAPTSSPSPAPTNPPTDTPTNAPSNYPTGNPTHAPTEDPTRFPTTQPTKNPTRMPTISAIAPTALPSIPPTKYSTGLPSISPTTAETIQTSEAPNRISTDNIAGLLAAANIGLIEMFFIGVAVTLILMCTIMYCFCRCKQSNAEEQAIVIKVQQTKPKAVHDDNRNSNKAMQEMTANIGKDVKHKKDEMINYNQNVMENQMNDPDVGLNKGRKQGDSLLLVTSEGPSYIDHNVIAMDDIAKDGIEPEQEGNGSSDSFDGMFVDAGENSVSKSKPNQNHDLGQETTKGVEDQKVAFHGTKGDYYDEYHHQIYEKRIIHEVHGASDSP